MPRVLLIDSEDRSRALLQCRLAADVKIKYAPSIESAWAKLNSRKFDLILWNAARDSAAQVNISETLKLLSTKLSLSTIVVLADDAALAGSRACIDNVFIVDSPTNDEELLSLVESHLPLKPRIDQVSSLADKCVTPIEFEGIIAVSLPMRVVIRQVLDAAAVDIPVLISGETGTGKELIAAAIHRRCCRNQKPYVAVNMGAMARELVASEIFGHERGAYTGAQEARPGLFEQADGGTVFLDEVATMDEKTQVSLLRVLEEKTVRRVGGIRNIGVDVRIIAATNENLERNVAEKRFREDLFYRLNVFPIRVPPLRERTAAITVLANHFLFRFCAMYGKEIDRVSPETYRLLRHHRWPGNVRELKNVMQTAVLMVEGRELTPEFIPQRVREAVGTNEIRGEPACSFRVGATLHGVENELIRMTLKHVGGNKKLAASVLGISRRALYNKIKRHRLP